MRWQHFPTGLDCFYLSALFWHCLDHKFRKFGFLFHIMVIIHNISMNNSVQILKEDSHSWKDVNVTKIEGENYDSYQKNQGLL